MRGNLRILAGIFLFYSLVAFGAFFQSGAFLRLALFLLALSTVLLVGAARLKPPSNIDVDPRRKTVRKIVFAIYVLVALLSLPSLYFAQKHSWIAVLQIVLAVVGFAVDTIATVMLEKKRSAET